MTTGLVMGTAMTQTILWIVTMMVETAVVLTSTHNSALNVCVLVVGIMKQMGLDVPRILTLWLAMVFVMISQTTLNVTMMVEIVVVQMHITVLFSAVNVNALPQIQPMQVQYQINQTLFTK